MTCLDDGMTRFTVTPGELFHLEIADTKDFAIAVARNFSSV